MKILARQKELQFHNNMHIVWLEFLQHIPKYCEDNTQGTSILSSETLVNTLTNKVKKVC